MIDKIFGRLTVISEGDRKYHYYCKCTCGTIKEIQKSSLNNGNCNSCGCLQKELAKKRHTKHGLNKHPIYSIWNSMVSRCYNSKSISFKNYGKKGITVCVEWRNKPNKFIKWATDNKWKKGLSIHRLNNNKNYNPNNCVLINKGKHAILHNFNTKTKNNTSGYVGVCFDSRSNKWLAYITINKKQKYLGLYLKIEDAVFARNSYATNLKCDQTDPIQIL